MLSDMLLSRGSFGVPRPSDSDFLRSLLHHFQSGWALKWASFTWKARSWYCCFSLGPRAYHHSPRILLTVRLSWLGCRWCTRARWRLLKIMNAFMGRRMWSFSLFLSPSLGRALRDCVRLFMGPVEGAGSLATPGENGSSVSLSVSLSAPPLSAGGLSLVGGGHDGDPLSRSGGPVRPSLTRATPQRGSLL